MFSAKRQLTTKKRPQRKKAKYLTVGTNVHTSLLLALLCLRCDGLFHGPTVLNKGCGGGGEYILKRDGFSAGYVSAGPSMGDNGNHTTTATTIDGHGILSSKGALIFYLWRGMISQ